MTHSRKKIKANSRGIDGSNCQLNGKPSQWYWGIYDPNWLWLWLSKETSDIVWEVIWNIFRSSTLPLASYPSWRHFPQLCSNLWFIFDSLLCDLQLSTGSSIQCQCQYVPVQNLLIVAQFTPQSVLLLCSCYYFSSSPWHKHNLPHNIMRLKPIWCYCSVLEPMPIRITQPWTNVSGLSESCGIMTLPFSAALPSDAATILDVAMENCDQLNNPCESYIGEWTHFPFTCL